MEYPRFLTPDFIPYNPLELAELTEKIVCKNDARKYTSFYCTGVYGGISTGYTVGCNLRCMFCWVSLSRDFPENYGKFYSSNEVFENLNKNAIKSGLKKIRISGGEPTLGKEHLLKLLDYVEGTDYLFILETNGILIGNDPSYAEALSNYKRIHVRVSLKAGSAEGFQRRTGAIGKFYELQYKAIEYLLAYKASVHVASMSDPRIMKSNEREKMIQKLYEIDKRIAINLEEESCDPYDMTLIRLKKAGYEIDL